MSLMRGRYGFRYECAMPGCEANTTIWAEDSVHINMPGTYNPPEPWHTEYGGVWCADHWPAIVAYREKVREIIKELNAFRNPLYAEIAEKIRCWEEAHPYPKPPWKDNA